MRALEPAGEIPSVAEGAPKDPENASSTMSRKEILPKLLPPLLIRGKQKSFERTP